MLFIRLLLIGILFLPAFMFAQKQTYSDFRSKNDNYFRTQLAEKPDDEQLLKEYKYYQRFTWFWDTRVDSKGLSDNYFLELNKFISNNNQIKTSVPYSAENAYKGAFWEIIGPNEYPVDVIPIHSTNENNRQTGIGRIDAIWVNPTDNNHILIGAFAGGLWETKNGGQNWHCLTEDLHTLSVHQIEVINGVIYIACGYEFGAKNFSNVSFGNRYGLGVIKSSDGGSTWQISSSNHSSKAFTHTNSANNSTMTMYSVDPRYVYKSTNGGNTWTKLQTISYTYDYHGDPTFNDVIVHPTNPNLVYVVGERGDGVADMIYKSTDGGASWQSQRLYFDNLANLPSNYAAVGGSFDYNEKTGKLYLILLYIGGSDRKSIIFESSNWNNWVKLPGNGMYEYPTYADVKTNIDGSRIYQLAINLIERTGGGSVQLSRHKIHDDIRGLEFSSDGNTMYAGHDGGISKSSDNGLTWTNINGDLNLNLTFEMGYYSDLNGRGKRFYDIGTQDCGWYRNKMDGTPRYKTMSHEGSVYTSPHRDRIYYKHGTNGLKISDDGGWTRTYLMWGSKVIQSIDFTSALIEDPVDKNIIYISSKDPNQYIHRLIKNSDYSSHPTVWQDIQPPTYNNQRGFAIHIPHSNNNVIYYVTTLPESPSLGTTTPDNIIWKSEDQGETWCNITHNLIPYFQGSHIRITSINSDSFNPNRVWISIGGISDDGSHVYYSSNGGNTWTNITYNLPNLPVNVIEYDENRKLLFIGTDYGVYYLDGTTWKEYGTDLPKAIVTSLFIDDLYNEILVSTFGRGTWKAPLEKCSDEVIYINTIWNSSRTICGDLIVKAGKTLTINSSDLVVRNIIIEPGAKIIWNGGSLTNSEDLGIRLTKGVCALYNGSLLRLNNVTVYNYDIQARQQSTVSLKTAILNNSSLNLNKDSYYHHLIGTSITLNTNSKVNFYEGFNYGFYSSLGLESTYVNNYSGIAMAGAGNINSYADQLFIRGQNFQSGNYNFYAYHNINTGIDAMSLSGNFIVQNDVKMKLEAGESILLDVGSEIKNSDFLAQITPKLAIPPVCKASYPPFSPRYEIEDNAVSKQETSQLEVNQAKLLDIYPNPSTGIFKYKLNNFERDAKYRITVYDLTGKNVLMINDNKQTGEINLSNHQSGTYALVLEIDGKTDKVLIIKK